MKLDFMKIRDTFLGYCMINAVTHKFKDMKLDIPRTEDGLYDIQFTVNNVEFPLQETFKDIEKQIDTMVEMKAYELIKEKLGDLNNIVYDITEDLRRKAKEKLNLDFEED